MNHPSRIDAAVPPAPGTQACGLLVDDSTGLVHRDSVDVRPGPTSIEHRAADGWVVGVGAESRGSTEAPSIDFEALDKIVSSIR
jgi:hypothetical protein